MSKIVKFNQVDITKPEQLIQFASTLKQMIVEQGLFTNIQGKNYVNVEGWQILGVVTGILPIITKVERQESEGNEILYRAEVELRRGDQVVGASIAVCSNKEKSRTNSDEYVIASMAQTRAIGKAYRNCLSWVIKMAGYESLPAEEAVKEKIDAKEVETEKECKRVLVHIAEANSPNKLQEVRDLAKKHGLNEQYDARLVELLGKKK